MGLYEEKDLPGGTVDVDTQSRTVVVNWSAFGSKDYDKDIIVKGAYEKTISERGPIGKGLIYAITDHEPRISNIIGSIKNLAETPTHLQPTIKISDTSWGNDVLNLYNDGIIKQHSVGFVALDYEEREDYRIIKTIQLYEGSAVLWGAQPDTGTVSVSKSLTTVDDCDKELNLLMKAWRNGKYTDETFGLIEIRIKQIQRIYHDLSRPEKSTLKGPEKSTQVSDKETIDFIKSLRKKLKDGKY